MIAWAHVLAWPVAAVLVSANLRRAIAATLIMFDLRKSDKP